jgi:hypothetical protein
MRTTSRSAVATVGECRQALDDLVATLASVEPELRARHVPRRTVCCRVSDLGISFIGRIDEHGAHDIREWDPDDDTQVDVTLTLDSTELVALAKGEDDFLHAWLRGRVQISAGVRDLLRLRSLFGL